MYIPISEDGSPFYHEGYVVRFFPTNAEPWVANFECGMGSVNMVFDLPEHNKIIVLAGGTAYLMSPDIKKPLHVFGCAFHNVLTTAEGDLILVDDIRITHLDRNSGALWSSERISWDGFRSLEIRGSKVLGESWAPGGSVGNSTEWAPFSLDLAQHTVSGGSYPNTLMIEHPYHFPSSTYARSLWDF